MGSATLAQKDGSTFRQEVSQRRRRPIQPPATTDPRYNHCTTEDAAGRFKFVNLPGILPGLT